MRDGADGAGDRSAEDTLFDRSFLPPARFELLVLSDTHYLLHPELQGGEWASVRQFPARAERALRLAGALRADVVVQGDGCVVQRAGHAPIEVGVAETLRRYLARRAELGLDCATTAPLMTDLCDHPLTVERLEAYYQAARTVRVSLEANSVFCRTLLTVCQPNVYERSL